ncbi:hypothetical protein G5V59_20070 [Nocardioides sp. W3-2-3]|nr:hypothetical protein [Nocardioides convexus]
MDKSENGRFERLAPLLEGAGISSAAFDLPGHGQSATPSSEANVEAMVWSLVDVLRWARGRSESVGLVSSSFSGAVTSLAWPLIRDLVNDQLVMINPVLRFDDTFVKPTQPEMAAMFNDSTFEQASRLGSLPTGPAFRNESGNVARIPSHGRCASLRTDRPSSLDLPRRCGRVDPV